MVGGVTTRGVFTEQTVPTPGSGPFYITAGPDLNIWFTEHSANNIGVLRGICPEGDGNGDFEGTHGHGNFKFHENACEKDNSAAGNSAKSTMNAPMSAPLKASLTTSMKTPLVTTLPKYYVNSTNRGDGKDFYSTHINSVKFDTVANTVTMIGLGTSDGVPVAFTFIALATGPTTPGWVSFAFSDGFTNAGILLNGSVILH